MACCKAACWLARVVLPQYLGPSIKTAPIASSFSANIFICNSCFIFFHKILFLISDAKIMYYIEYQANKIVKPCYFPILLWQLALFRYGSWRFFVVTVGAFSLWQLAELFLLIHPYIIDEILHRYSYTDFPPKKARLLFLPKKRIRSQAFLYSTYLIFISPNHARSCWLHH